MTQSALVNAAEALNTTLVRQTIYITEVPELPPLPTLGALDLHTCAAAIARLGRLTDREHVVLVPLLSGSSNDEISRSTKISRRAVKFHVSNILRKLRVSQRCELLRFLF